MDLELNDDGDCINLYQHVKDFLDLNIQSNHPFFFNQLYADISFPALIGEFASILANTSMATYETSPTGTAIEQTTLNKLNSIIGYDQGEGIFVLGGSYSNMVAMVCARNEFFLAVKQQGLTSISKPLTCFISEEAHYSLLKAANLIGIGTENVIKIKSDDQGKMIPELLEEQIIKSRLKKENPFFICATAGTTITGSIDPISELVILAKKYGLWLHVDGAFGGSLLLLEQFQHEFKNVKQANSFTWDMHKVLGVPLTNSAILLRDKGILKKSISGGGELYLFHDQEEHNHNAINFGEKSFQCGRKVDSFKVWLNWKYYGTNGLARRVDTLLKLIKFAENYVENHPSLRIIVPRQSLTLCFSYFSKNLSLDQTNEINLKVRTQMIEQGTCAVNYAYWKNYLVIRLVCLNPATTIDDLTKFFKIFVNMAQRLEKFKIS